VQVDGLSFRRVGDPPNPEGEKRGECSPAPAAIIVYLPLGISRTPIPPAPDQINGRSKV